MARKTSASLTPNVSMQFFQHYLAETDQCWCINIILQWRGAGNGGVYTTTLIRSVINEHTIIIIIKLWSKTFLLGYFVNIQ